MSISNTEEALLCNFEDELDTSEFPSYLKDVWQGNWQDLLEKCMNTYVSPSKLNKSNFQELIEKHANETNREEMFCTGLACILTFIQANFTGPPLPSTNSTFLDKHHKLDVEKILNIDGEEINVNVEHPELLITAMYIFEYCKIQNEFIPLWWSLRCSMVHQVLLDDCSPTLFTSIETLVEKLSNWDFNNIRLKAKLQLEISHIYSLYGKINDTDVRLNRAKEFLGINLELSGELGKRTRYQQRDIAQIKLLVKLSEDVPRPVLKSTEVPNVISLDDDVRLDKIQYTTEQNSVTLPDTEQTAVLATVHFLQRSRPKDELLLEESEAFCSFLLQQNNSWALRVACLLLRCRLESTHKRTVERALMQCESIIENLRSEEPSNFHRIGVFWTVSMPPRWQIEAQTADLMLNLGMVKGCLDIFLRLQLWEEVIVCYTILNLRHKAAGIIHEQLSINPSVKLLCLLGDATDDVLCYDKAWKLSEERSSRAQRHWGQYLFARKEFTECIPHLQKSLEINSLQNMVLLRLGYAALNVEDWQLAASTYRKYTCLEPGSFEAWNNLAKAYVKLGEKDRAHFALQEALKYSFDNWRVWDNFMVVSADTGHLEDIVRAYHQILDIKEKHLDFEVLFVLAKEIMTDVDGKYTAGRLKAKTLELFGRLTSIYPGESKLWEMYADLSPSPDLKAQRLYRAYRGLVQDDWSKDPTKCGKVLEICNRLGEVALTADASSLSSARLTLRAAVAAAKRHSWEQNADILTSVENVLEKIMNVTTNPKS